MTTIQNIATSPEAVPHYHGRPMSMERLRRQVYTVAVWAHKCDQDVIEDWASKSVLFIAEQMEDYAKKIAQLRADNSALRAKLSNIPVATMVEN